MKVVGLISGGKDSCYNMMQCVAEGHNIVALANLKPKDKDELDSYMYQTVGHHAIDLYAEAMDLPLYRRTIEGGSLEQGRDYKQNSQDEVEDLYILLKEVMEATGAEAVSVGAILSDYQRVRVENVCSRLGLTPLAYLWRRDQDELLNEMIQCDVDAILIKVAALGLDPKKHLGVSLKNIQSHMQKMKELYGLNVCGEGGEYETFTLDCPLFLKKLVIDERKMVIHSDDAFAPVAYLNFESMHLEDKHTDRNLTQYERIKHLSMKRSSDLAADLELSPEQLQVNESTAVCCKCLQNQLKDRVKIQHCRDAGLVHITGVYGVGDVSVAEQTLVAMDSLQVYLTQCGLSMDNIVAMYVYVADMTQFHRINAVYKKYFNLNPPVRVCVQSPLPINVGIQLDCVASTDEKLTMHVQGLSHWAPANIGPYSQAVLVNNSIFVAGQIGMKPADLSIIPGGVSSEARLSLRHVERIIPAIRSAASLLDMTLVICYVTRDSYISEAESEYQNIIRNSDRSMCPLTIWAVVPALPKGALVEWQVRVHVPSDNDVICDTIKKTTAHDNLKCQAQSLVSSSHLVALSLDITTVSEELYVNADSIHQLLHESVKSMVGGRSKPGALRVFYKADALQLADILQNNDAYYTEAYPVTFIPVCSLKTDKHILSACM